MSVATIQVGFKTLAEAEALLLRLAPGYEIIQISDSDIAGPAIAFFIQETPENK